MYWHNENIEKFTIKTLQVSLSFSGEIEELKQDLSSFRFEMLNTLETHQKALSEAVGVINSKLDLMFSGVSGAVPGGLPTAPPPPPPPGGYAQQPQPPYTGPSGQFSSSDQYGGTELYVRPPDPDPEGSHVSRPITRDRPGSDHSDTHASLSFIPEEREEGGGNASETDSMIHGHCSDPDDDCGVSIDEEEIVPQKASTADQKPRKRSKKRRSSSTSSIESTTPALRPITQTVAEVRSPYYSDSSPHHLASTQSSASGSGSGGEQFKPRYISNTEELNKLVRLLEPHS